MRDARAACERDVIVGGVCAAGVPVPVPLLLDNEWELQVAYHDGPSGAVSIDQVFAIDKNALEFAVES